MKRQLLYFALICVVPAILYVLSLEKVIPTPVDDTHAGLTEEIQCFECHGEGRDNARKKEHPPKDQCFKCH
ncbi:MAG: hypothetical protein OEW04_15120 [Nitrospirota bacterium]|nr:hypothetical protein [Nitrospirota bacterium]